MTRKLVFKLSALSAALLSAYGTAFAEDDEIARLIKPESSVSVGVGNWSHNRPQQGGYDGMRSDGAYLLLDADIVQRDDTTGTWTTFSTRNLGTDARELEAGYQRQGNIGGTVRYNEIPRDNPLTFNTGLQGIGSALLRTPATANPTRSEVTLGTKRKQLDFDFYKYISPELVLNINFKNEDKDGTRLWGRGGAAEFSVEPIDANTKQFEAKLSHLGKKLQLTGGYYGSWYKNANSYVDTALTTGASPYYLSLPQDNEAHQFFLNGGYSFTPTTRGTFKLEYTRATQNERLPMSDIAGLPLAGAPTNLNGRIDTTLMQLGLTSRPMRDLSFVADLRYRNEKDKTPVARYVQTAYAGHTCDGNANIACVDNTPFSYKTLSGKLEGTYRLPNNFSLIAGIDQKNQDRTVPVNTGTVVGGVDDQRYVPFRAKLEESTYRLQLRRSLSDTLNGSLAYLHSKRDGSTYSRTNEDPSDEINPIHIADRKRDKWRFSFDWSPVDTLTLQFNYENAKDEYAHDEVREYGLRDGKATLYSLDATYSLNDNWQLNAWYSYDNTRANQFNGRWQQTTEILEAQRWSHLKDIGESVGFGLRGKLTGKIKAGADLQLTTTKSEYPSDITTTGAGGTLTPYPAGVSALPAIKNSILTIKLFGEYALDKNADLRVNLIHERWKTNDWSWLFSDGSPFTYGATTDGTQVLANPKQNSTFLGARYIYKFQ